MPLDILQQNKIMDLYLTDLLQRIGDDTFPEGYVSSEDIPSWKACREAEKLTNESYIPQLIGYIEQQKDDKKRSDAYFVLGKICENTGNKEGIQFVIDRAYTEISSIYFSNIMNSIRCAKKPMEINLTPIFDLLHSNINIRNIQDVVAILQHSENPQAEDEILAILNRFEDIDHFILWHSLYALSSIGTRNSIPHLIRLTSHKKIDISSFAINLLVALGDDRELPVFEQNIIQGRNKDLALMGLSKFGNQTHIPLIIRRLKEVLSRKRTTIIIIDCGKDKEEYSEVMIGLSFLKTYEHQAPEIPKFLETIKNKKWNKLFPDEQEHFDSLFEGKI